MYDRLVTPEQVYGAWLATVVFLGGFVFLRLAAVEWAYREAWLRHDARRRAKRAELQARIARNARAAQGIGQAGQYAGTVGEPVAAVAAPALEQIDGSSAAA
jgi:hypothetical protein